MIAYMGTLNDAQTKVLRWIADGCPEGVMRGYEHRISAAALRTRDLVRLSGHGKTWQAHITERGHEFLERDSMSDQKHAPRREPGPRSSDPRAFSTARSKPAAPRRLSPTAQLVADVIAAGGALRVPAWRREGDPDYRQRVLAAQRFAKAPAGKRLTMGNVRGETEIRLEDAIPGTEVEAAPVSVPQRAPRLHPVAKRFRDETDKHEVSRKALSRCVRIVHAVVTEAERRGFGVANVTKSTQSYRGEAWSAKNDGHLIITVRGHSYHLRVTEEKVANRGAFDAETEYRASVRYPEYLRPRTRTRYDSEATGRLQITADQGHNRGGRASMWADRRSWTLEEKLPELLQELEIRAAEDDHRQAEAERAAEKRRRQWEAAMEMARQHFLEAQRAQVLRSQVAAWQETQALRDYLTALREKHSGASESAEWIAWACRYIDERLDPLASPPALPPEPDVRPEDLKPFLGGLSPYGPSSW